jgi:hypothetical protein
MDDKRVGEGSILVNNTSKVSSAVLGVVRGEKADWADDLEPGSSTEDSGDSRACWSNGLWKMGSRTEDTVAQREGLPSTDNIRDKANAAALMCVCVPCLDSTATKRGTIVL